MRSLERRQWRYWIQLPVSVTSQRIKSTYLRRQTVNISLAHNDARTYACFTCGECSSACPIACERDVFDPRTIFRMVNLGLTRELLRSPAIWLCVSCGRCTRACSQLVDGCRLIDSLRKLALESGAVDPGFPHRLQQADRLIYARFLEEVDRIFEFRQSPDDCPAEDGRAHFTATAEKCALAAR